MRSKMSLPEIWQGHTKTRDEAEKKPMIRY